MTQATEYRVGVVLPQAGLNDNQMLDLGERLRFIAEACERDPGPKLSLVLVVAAQDLEKPTEISPQVAKSLQYKARCEVRPLAKYRKPLHGSVPEFLFDSLRRCDEVWCCTAAGTTMSSKARGAALYRRAQEEGHIVGSRFKLVPAWVSAPPAGDKAKAKKARKELRWKDVF